jgi:rRNA maturation endonuclease Nob1
MAYGEQQLGVTDFTVTEKLKQQQRFFCENCKQEVFLQAKYCDKCGGQIEWPEKIQKIIAPWKTTKNDKKEKK